MWGKGPPKDNEESWRDIHAFIGEYPDDNTWREWKARATAIVTGLERLKLSRSFRIGQSMHHIIISTVDHHQLTTEPRVTVAIAHDHDEVTVAYGERNLWFDESQDKRTVRSSEAIACIVPFLRRLWQTTKSDEIPEGLNIA